MALPVDGNLTTVSRLNVHNVNYIQKQVAVNLFDPRNINCGHLNQFGSQFQLFHFSDCF